MPPLLVRFAAVLVVFLALDAVWLTLAADPIYRAELGALLKPQFDVPVAAGFYVFYAFALTVIAVGRAAETGRLGTATAYGALLGAAAYGTYDLTNLSTLEGWTVKVAVVDLVWGTTVSAVSATLGTLIARRFGKA